MPYDLTVTGSSFNASGKFGQSMSGTTYARGAAGIATGLNDVTVECWVKTTNVATQCAAGIPGLVWVGTDSAGKPISVCLHPSSGSDVVITGPAPITDGAWHHLAVCIGTSGTKFYLDGTLVGSNALGMTAANRHYEFGIKTLPDNGLLLNGEVDEVAFWDTIKYPNAFTPATAPLVDNQPNLLAVYHLNGNAVNSAGSGPTAPVFDTAPAINGTPRVGQATSFTSGTITTSEAPTVTQQWTLDGVDIAGATGATYTPVAGDVGKALRVRQKAVNSVSPGGVTSTSAPVTVLAAATPNTRNVSITLYADKGVRAANKTGIKVSFSTGTGPHSPGTMLFQSGTATTDANGVLAFTFESAAIAVGQSGLLMVLGAAGEHYIGMAVVA